MTMNNPFHPVNGITIYDRADYDVQHLSAASIDGLMSDDEEALLLEPTTLEDIEHTYLGEHLADSTETAMFEAVSTTKTRLANTMRAFVRVLNRGLNGTGIVAGTHDAGTDETGVSVAGGAQIGNVRKVAGVPVMVAKIPCTDGQSVSLIFHSPTAEGAKLVGSDALVAFKFLLNKRDVTHVVAPIGGRDMSLDQTAQSLSNLIERNSAKFQKQQETHSKLKASADSAEDEANKLEQQAADEMARADALSNAQPKLDSELSKTNATLKRIKQTNGDLEKQIADLKAKKAEKQAKQGNEAGKTESEIAAAKVEQGEAKHEDGEASKAKNENLAAEQTAKSDRDNLKTFVGATANITDAYDFYRWFYRSMGDASGINPLKRSGEGGLSMDDWMARLKDAFPDVAPTGDVEGDQNEQQAWFELIFANMFPGNGEPEATRGSGTIPGRGSKRLADHPA